MIYYLTYPKLISNIARSKSGERDRVHWFLNGLVNEFQNHPMIGSQHIPWAKSRWIQDKRTGSLVGNMSWNKISTYNFLDSFALSIGQSFLWINNDGPRQHTDFPGLWKSLNCDSPLICQQRSGSVPTMNQFECPESAQIWIDPKCRLS